MRKAIQISALPGRSDTPDSIIVLCDDGAIFETWVDETETRRWIEVEGMPQPQEMKR